MKRKTDYISKLFAALLLIVLVIVIPASAAPVSNGSSTATGGQITEINFSDVTSTTGKWQGYFGNVTNESGENGLQLESGGNVMYSWNYNLSNLAGNIFATLDNVMDLTKWDQLGAATPDDIDTAYNFTSSNSDSANNTLSGSQALTVAGRVVNGPYVQTYNATLSPTWKTVALSRLGGSNMTDFVFAGMIDSNQEAFDGTTKDFQMVVPVNASESPQTYFFYVELT